jgi:hypothetical protein
MRCAALLLGMALALVPGGGAMAYRPFDGTDAAVADPGEFELELGPLGYLREGSENSLVVPNGVLNLGVAPKWELVLQGQGESPLARSVPFTFGGTGFFLKHVLREGALQEQSGVSIAAEFGVLTPGINTDGGTGASVAGIVSQRWPWGTAHLNVATALTRDQHADLFVGTILEGPADWTVRPVAEVFVEHDVPRTTTMSGLIGAIWRVGEHLSFDVGVRRAEFAGRGVDEVRAGLTVSFGVW